MPKPICVKCGLFYKPKKCGVTWEEGFPQTIRVFGAQEQTEWVPYKLWVGDLMECRGCGDQIISGHGHSPIAEQHYPNYADIVARFSPVFVRVNDC